METIGLYEEELSLFGDQLLGLGSLEPDSPVSFPDARDGIKFLEPLDSGLKTVYTTSTLSKLPSDDTEDALWENASWLDTQLDVFNFLDVPGEVRSTVESDASISPLAQQAPFTVEDALTAEDLFKQISTEIVPEKGDVSDSILSELLKKLGDYNHQSVMPDLGRAVLSPVSVDDIESLLSGPVSPTSSEATDQSFLPSRPDSPSYTEQYEMMKDGLLQSPEKPEKTASKNRYKPYSRSVRTPSDRKERKKVQNKTAALKYRQKKKTESEHIGESCEVLEAKNVALKEKVDSMTREITYLKDLMADVLKAKGITKKKKVPTATLR